MRAYEIPDFMNKKIRRNCWKNVPYVEYYHNKKIWIYDTADELNKTDYVHLLSKDDWEEYSPPEQHKQIELTQGYLVKVSLSDFEYLRMYQWTADTRDRVPYDRII